MKKWYTVSFQCKMDEDDVKAMNSCFYQAMKESMNIDTCAALDIDLHCDQEDEYIECYPKDIV